MKRLALVGILFLASCSKNPLGNDGNVPVDHNPYLNTCPTLLVKSGYDLNNSVVSGTYPNCTFTCKAHFKLGTKKCDAQLLFTEDFDFSSVLDFLFDDTTAELDSYWKLSPSKLKSSFVLGDIPLLDGTLSAGLFDDGVSLYATTSSEEYVSVAFDGKNTDPLSSLFFKTSLPFGKELTIDPETSYGASVFDFSDELQALWHFNEPTYTAGQAMVIEEKNGNDATPYGNITSSSGMFSGAAYFNGSSYMQVNDSSDLDNASVFTVAFWVYPQTLDGVARSVISKRVSTSATNNSYSFFFYNQNRLSIDINGPSDRFTTNTVFTTNRWYHVVIVFDGSKIQAQRVSVYVDGLLDRVAAEASTAIVDSASNLYFGTMNFNDGRYFHGRLDEVAIWKKALTLDNVQELYRRGSNRVKLQVRSCESILLKDCDGATTSWVGPDGSSASFFSELNNFDVLGLSPSSYATDFSLFPSLTPFLATGHRYHQVKASLESDTTLFYPDLLEVGFTPSPRYAFVSEISSKASVSISFDAIDDIEVEETCEDENSNPLVDQVLYEFSVDGVNYLGFDGTDWVASSPMTRSQIDALTTADFNLLTSGNLSVKFQLQSTGLSSCGVDRIRVHGRR